VTVGNAKLLFKAVRSGPFQVTASIQSLLRAFPATGLIPGAAGACRRRSLIRNGAGSRRALPRLTAQPRLVGDPSNACNADYSVI